MLLGLEATYVGIKHSDAVYVAFFGMSAQELLTDANSQNGLSQLTDDFVQMALSQILHGSSRFSLSRKHDTVGTTQLLGIVCQQRFYSQTFQGVDNRIDIAGIIFYDCYIHWFLNLSDSYSQFYEKMMVLFL